MKKFLEAYQDFKDEGLLFGYSNNFLIFLKNYFIDGIYK
jgi:hypothetical protein